jgi:hypothetical protein
MFTQKLQIFVPEHGPGKQLQFQKNLETVTNSQNETSLLDEFLEFLHKRGEFGYRPRAQIVSVGKPPRKDDAIGIFQVVLFVPEIKSLLAENVFEDMECVMIAVGTGKNDNTKSQLNR